MKRKLKRLYETVAVSPAGDHHAVFLDARPAKIGSVPLELPTHALAEAVALEWREQEKGLNPERMRLTGLAGTALTQVAAVRGQVIEHILSFGHHELLCYRAAAPLELAERQKGMWDPLLEWVQARHGVRLIADSGISFIEQPVDAVLRMQAIVSGLDDFELAALDAAASLAASFVVALALMERHIGAEEAFSVSHLDELYQAEKWGSDPEAESRRACIVDELKAVERFVALLN